MTEPSGFLGDMLPLADGPYPLGAHHHVGRGRPGPGGQPVPRGTAGARWPYDPLEGPVVVGGGRCVRVRRGAVPHSRPPPDRSAPRDSLDLSEPEASSEAPPEESGEPISTISRPQLAKCMFLADADRRSMAEEKRTSWRPGWRLRPPRRGPPAFQHVRASVFVELATGRPGSAGRPAPTGSAPPGHCGTPRHRLPRLAGRVLRSTGMLDLGEFMGAGGTPTSTVALDLEEMKDAFLNPNGPSVSLCRWRPRSRPGSDWSAYVAASTPSSKSPTVDGRWSTGRPVGCREGTTCAASRCSWPSTGWAGGGVRRPGASTWNRCAPRSTTLVPASRSGRSAAEEAEREALISESMGTLNGVPFQSTTRTAASGNRFPAPLARQKCLESRNADDLGGGRGLVWFHGVPFAERHVAVPVSWSNPLLRSSQ